MKHTFQSIFTAILITLFSISFIQADSLTNGGNSVLGKVGKKTIRIDHVNDKNIHELRTKLYQAVQQKFMLVAVEEMLKAYPKIKAVALKPVTEKQISDFYYQRGLQSQGTLNQLKPAIQNYLVQSAKFAQIGELYAQGVAKGRIKVTFQEPAPFILKVPVETAFIRGNKNASVIVLEFSDYQCPFCGRVQPSLKKLMKKYSEKVAFGYRHFPLGFHEQADDAANAAECAREQGKFAPYHDTLFKNPKALYDNDLKRYAQKVGITDMNRFNNCLTTRKYDKRVQYDIAVAQKYGVSGTPAFFIGKWNKKADQVEGEFLNGAQPYEAFEKLIIRYLK